MLLPRGVKRNFFLRSLRSLSPVDPILNSPAPPPGLTCSVLPPSPLRTSSVAHAALGPNYSAAKFLRTSPRPPATATHGHPRPTAAVSAPAGNSLLARRRAQVDLGDDLARRALAVVRVDAGALPRRPPLRHDERWCRARTRGARPQGARAQGQLFGDGAGGVSRSRSRGARSGDPL